MTVNINPSEKIYWTVVRDKRDSFTKEEVLEILEAYWEQKEQDDVNEYVDHFSDMLSIPVEKLGEIAYNWSGVKYQPRGERDGYTLDLFDKPYPPYNKAGIKKVK